MPYLDNVVESNICPTFDSEYRRLYKEEVSYSYSFNYWLSPGCISKDSMVKTPSETFWAGEEALWSMYYENPNGGTPLLVNGYIVNDNSLCAQWPMDLNGLKTKTQNNYPPYSGTYTDCFGDFHKGSAYASSLKKKPSGGTTNAVCLDGHVEEVEPTDTYRYANGL